jgi:Flp pilus assembly protein TadB
VHSLSRQRSLAALGAILLYPVALHVPALLTLALVLVLLCLLIVYEVTRFAETRERVRHELARGQVPAALAEIARMSE